MGRPKKTAEDKFEALEEEFKTAMLSADNEELKKNICETALYQVELAINKKNDMHLKEVHDTYKDAAAQYVEGNKICKLKLQFLKLVLEDRGVDISNLKTPAKLAVASIK